MHGVITGHEDRQLLYTMITRGRAANHLHLITEQPDTKEDFLPGIEEQLTTVDALDRIVGRDGVAVSATTELANATSPATRLHEAASRSADPVTPATHHRPRGPATPVHDEPPRAGRHPHPPHHRAARHQGGLPARYRGTAHDRRCPRSHRWP